MSTTRRRGGPGEGSGGEGPFGGDDEVARARSLARFPQENPHPVLRLSSEGVLLYANSASFATLSTLQLESGRPAPAVLADPSRLALETGTRCSAEVLCSGRWFSMAFCPVGREVNIYGFDVTERKLIEQERERLLGEVERRAAELDAVFDSMADGLVVTGPAGDVVRTNPAFERMFGVPSDWFRLPFEQRIRLLQNETPDRQPLRPEQSPGARALRGETVRDFLQRVRRPDGRTVWASTSSAPIRSGSAVSGAVVSFQDITERRQAVEALQQSELRFRLALRNAPVTVAAQDRDLRFVWAYNQRTATASEILGKTDADLFLPEEAERLAALKRRAMDTDAEVHEQLWLVRKGHPLYLDIFIEPMRNEQGEVVGVGVATVDLTPLKLAEKAASDAKNAAEEANAAKDRFLANVSHELRTPLSGILGMTEMAMAEHMSATARDYVVTARESAAMLLALVDELLDYSRMEAGKFKLTSEPFALRATLEQTMRSLRAAAQEAGLELRWYAAPDVPDQLRGDPQRLRQVLTNLAGNAIKFTQQGSVSVRVELVSSPLHATHTVPPDEVLLQFAVADTGIGISPEARQVIFAPFVQADDSAARRYPGAGLGLAICAHLVGLMGGVIDVQSEPGRGSTFTFKARFAVSATDHESRPATPSQPPAPERQLRILVAEDSRPNQIFVQGVLRKRGHHVDLACNGEEAVRLAGDSDYDVILMDVMMPILDGLQATQAVRMLDNSFRATRPIVGLTAQAMSGDKERCLAAGMDSYVSKPIDSQVLIAVVERLARERGVP